jgi:histidinol-phosphate aminotransferase
MIGSLEAAVNPLVAAIDRTAEPPPLPAAIVRLDRNERVGPYPPAVAREIFAGLTAASLCQYPDTSNLYRALVRHTSLPRTRLLLVPGSDAAFRALAHVFVRSGDGVAMLNPSYQMYPVYTRMFGGTPLGISIRPDGTVDFDDLTTQTAGSKMLWLANPNQPSGTVIAAERVLALTRHAARTGTLVVVDEAYYPFGGTTVIDQVMAHENLVVIRSFSKAFGLAGVRLGFVAGSEAVVNALFKVRTCFDINALAIAAGEWALAHPDVVGGYVREAQQSAALLQAVAARHDLSAPASAANFQLIRVGPRFEAEAIKRACWNHGYAIAAPVAPPFGDHIRVTTGALDVLAPFADMLDRVLNEAQR